MMHSMLMERLDVSRDLSDQEVLEDIDRLILREPETFRLQVSDKFELRQELFFSVRKLDVLQELLEDDFEVVDFTKKK